MFKVHCLYKYSCLNEESSRGSQGLLTLPARLLNDMDYLKFKLSIAFAGQALYIQTLLKLRILTFVTVLEITR